MREVLIEGSSFQACKKVISNIPGDKSISHRVAMLAPLAQGQTFFSGFLCSEDCLNTVSIMRALGADIQLDLETGEGVIFGQGLSCLSEPSVDLDVGNSGTSIRLLSGLLAAQSFNSVLTGDASIVQRPMKRVIDPLTQMGAVLKGRLLEGREDVFPPLYIEGSQLSGIRYASPVASAQVKSAILIAGLFVTGGRTVVIEPRKSRDHTERMLRGFGVSCVTKGLEIILDGPDSLKAPSTPLVIPSDFSSAAFFIVLASVCPDVEFLIQNVGLNETRSTLLDVLLDMGADIKIENLSGEQFEPFADIRIRGKKLKNVTLSSERVPFIIDEIPILAVAALFSEGTLVVSDAQELRVKESDRILGIVRLVESFGGRIEEHPDGFVLSGQTIDRKMVEYDCRHDHRLAMSAIIAALITGSDLRVSDVSCIQTSFPVFFDILRQIGVTFTG